MANKGHNVEEYQKEATVREETAHEAAQQGVTATDK
jgi:hypothetical protein